MCTEYTALKFFSPFSIFEQLALALKNRFDLKFFTVLKYFLSFRIFEQLMFALKREFVLKIFTVLNILFTFRISEQLALSLKNRVCLDFTYWMRILYHSGFLSNLRLPWKFHCFEIFFIIQEYWVALVLKTGVCPENFHWIEIFFIIQEACPENRICPEGFQAGERQPSPSFASYTYGPVA